MQAGSRYHPFVTDVQKTCAEVPEQVDLEIGRRRKAGMPAFGRQRMIPLPVPIQHGLAESGSRRDQNFGAVFLPFAMDHFGFFQLEDQYAVGHGFDVIKQAHAGGVQGFGQGVTVDDPRKIRGAAAVVDNRAGDAETGRLERHGR